MSTYRWDKTQFAAGYDAAAAYIHPLYTTIQEKILELLPCSEDQAFLLVDAGGGSGRLAEKVLERYPFASAVVMDQSEAFLELAQARMARFDNRGQTVLARLQDDWLAQLPAPPNIIVSMSAIHHLTPDEKLTLYGRMHDALAEQGVLLNGDEVRPADDADYLRELNIWSDHMRQMQDSAHIPPQMDEILGYWREKNITGFGGPRISGDDCHETASAQMAYFRSVGFAEADVPWQQGMWAILRGVKG